MVPQGSKPLKVTPPYDPDETETEFSVLSMVEHVEIAVKYKAANRSAIALLMTKPGLRA
jgi:hypothetical protein